LLLKLAELPVPYNFTCWILAAAFIVFAVFRCNAVKEPVPHPCAITGNLMITRLAAEGATLPENCTADDET
jgi:hypothetical protein